MRQAFKFQLMRSKRTRHIDRAIDAAAHIWNHSVAAHKRYYRRYGKTLKQGMLQSLRRCKPSRIAYTDRGTHPGRIRAKKLTDKL